MIDKKIKEIAILNGIGFKYMTNYRAMLVHLRNNKHSAKQIAFMINDVSCEIKVNGSTVENWFSRGTQPKDEIIEILENWLHDKILDDVQKTRNPKLG